MSDQRLLTLELEGRKIRVPPGLTVIEALWDSGHDIKRGIGCLSGLCGACTVAYLEKGGQKVRFGLGCQVLVAEGMKVIMLPYFPSRVAPYRLEELPDPFAALPQLYPELAECTGCRACNVCPEWINVAEVMRQAKEGEGEGAKGAAAMMGCHLCGLCASRCPRSIAPHLIGLYLQRASARQLPGAPHLERRLTEVEEGRWTQEWERIGKMDDQELADYCRHLRGT